MNVNYDSNENIWEATVTITFPCKQSIKKHDMNKFDMNTESEILLPYKWGKAQCVFPAAVILNIANQSRHQFSVSFLKICSFSYGHLFLVSIFYQLTSEKNQVHGGDLAHCKQTL